MNVLVVTLAVIACLIIYAIVEVKSLQTEYQETHESLQQQIDTLKAENTALASYLHNNIEYYIKCGNDYEPKHQQ